MQSTSIIRHGGRLLGTLAATAVLLIGPCVEARADINDLGDSAIAQIRAYQEGRAAFKFDGGWGFLDTKGRVSVPPRYDAVGSFSDGMAEVAVGDHWGYVDASGQERIAPAYERVGPFSQGRAAVLADDGRWGYLDHDGQWAIAPVYAAAGRFMADVAAVQTAEGRSLLIDRSGQVVKTLDAGQQIDTWGRKTATLVVTRQAGERLMHVDGRTLAMPDIDPGRIEAASEDRLVVRVSRDGEVRFGATDLSGHWVIEPRFEALGPFVDGLAIARRDGGVGLVDRLGTPVVPATQAALTRLDGGLYLARRDAAGNAAYTVFAADGSALFESDCASLGYRRLGRWSVVLDCGRIWAVSPSGALHQVAAEWPELAARGDYLLVQHTGGVRVDGHWTTPFTLFGPDGVVVSSAAASPAGRYAWAMLIRAAAPSADGAAALPLALLVAHDGAMALVDADGRLVENAAWRYDARLANYGGGETVLEGPLVVPTEAGWGAVDAHGAWHIDPGFDQLDPFVQGVARAQRGADTVLVDAHGHVRVLAEDERLEQVSGRGRALIARGEGREARFVEADLAAGDERAVEPPGARGYGRGFKGGLVPVEADGLWGLRNRVGDWVLSPRYDRRPEAQIRDKQLLGWKVSHRVPTGNRWSDTVFGWVSPEGEEVVAPAFERLSMDSDSGLLTVRSRQGRRQGLIRPDGRVVFAAEYERIAALGHGWYTGRVSERKGLMAPDGHWLLAPGPYELVGWGEGGYVREHVDGEDVYIDRQGRLSSAAQPAKPLEDDPDDWQFRTERGDGGTQTTYFGFDWQDRVTVEGSEEDGFHDGLLTVSRFGGSSGRQWFLVDRTGRFSAPMGFDRVGWVAGGHAVVRQAVDIGDGRREVRYGYVDRRGRTVVAPRFERAEDFSEGRAVVVDKGNYGVIDGRGRLLVHGAWRCGVDPVLIDAQQRIVWPAGVSAASRCPAPGAR